MMREAAEAWPFGASHFGSFWVHAAARVVSQGHARVCGEGQVAAFDVGIQMFTVSIRGQGRIDVSRA
eukprot:7735493-Pyramimonas_sp.AAC.1